MDEFTALAQQVAVGAGDVRGCLIVSRDGLVLGGFPAGNEAVAKPAWLRFAALGEPQKGFVEFPDQLWAYVHRGPYAAFAVAEPSVRPGLLMDRLEQALLAAEEARTRREPLRVAESPAPSGKPRAPLHPVPTEPAEERPEVTVSATPPAATERAEATSPASTLAQAPVVGTPATEDRAPSEATGAAPEATEGSGPADGDATSSDEAPADRAAPPRAGEKEAERPLSRDDTDETEVDRVLLAKEFSGLLQMDEDLDDAGS
jgi:hypothetical protein